MFEEAAGRAYLESEDITASLIRPHLRETSASRIESQEMDVLGRSQGVSNTESISLAFKVPRVAIR